VGDPSATAAAPTGAAVDPKLVAGSYLLAEAGMTVSIAYDEGKLTMSVPGQPTYPLELLAGSRYKLAAPAPPGFFATFRPAKENAKEFEIYLEQPQGNFVLKHEKAAAAPVAAGDLPAALAEIVGSYENAKQ